MTYVQAGIEHRPASWFDAVLPEYPLPAVLVMAIPWALTRGLGAPALYTLFLVLLELPDGGPHRGPRRAVGPVVA